MEHPLDESVDAILATLKRLQKRRDAVEAKISKLSLAMFRCDQFADLQLLYDRSAPSKRSSDLIKALDRLEAFLSVVE